MYCSIMYQIMLCANNTTVIKTDTGHHLIEFSVWEREMALYGQTAYNSV